MQEVEKIPKKRLKYNWPRPTKVLFTLNTNCMLLWWATLMFTKLSPAAVTIILCAPFSMPFTRWGTHTKRIGIIFLYFFIGRLRSHIITATVALQMIEQTNLPPITCYYSFPFKYEFFAFSARPPIRNSYPFTHSPVRR